MKVTFEPNRNSNALSLRFKSEKVSDNRRSGRVIVSAHTIRSGLIERCAIDDVITSVCNSLITSWTTA